MSDEWLSARDALALATQHMSISEAKTAILTRAFDQLIRARAKRLVSDGRRFDDTLLSFTFWFPKGIKLFRQNWATGDFESMFRSKRLRAYGVEFNKQHILDFLGLKTSAEPLQVPLASVPSAKGGPGRPRAPWWEDLLIAILGQLHLGTLIPTKQADIEKAMHAWIAEHGYDSAEAGVRTRASKIWKIIESEAKKP